eukprot:COSAG05_NODE_4697_length_1406_cov_1.350421_2_plen_77_part_00
MLRLTELLEDMQKEAFQNGAGAGVHSQWDKMFDEVASTKRHFEHVMTLYKIPDVQKNSMVKQTSADIADEEESLGE